MKRGPVRLGFQTCTSDLICCHLRPWKTSLEYRQDNQSVSLILKTEELTSRYRAYGKDHSFAKVKKKLLGLEIRICRIYPFLNPHIKSPLMLKVFFFRSRDAYVQDIPGPAS